MPNVIDQYYNTPGFGFAAPEGCAIQESLDYMRSLYFCLASSSDLALEDERAENMALEDLIALHERKLTELELGGFVERIYLGTGHLRQVWTVTTEGVRVLQRMGELD